MSKELSEHIDQVNRRRILATLGSVSCIGVTGCTSGGSSTPTDAKGSTSPSSAQSPAGSSTPSPSGPSVVRGVSTEDGKIVVSLSGLDQDATLVASIGRFQASTEVAAGDTEAVIDEPYLTAENMSRYNGYKYPESGTATIRVEDANGEEVEVATLSFSPEYEAKRLRASRDGTEEAVRLEIELSNTGNAPVAWGVTESTDLAVPETAENDSGLDNGRAFSSTQQTRVGEGAILGPGETETYTLELVPDPAVCKTSQVGLARVVAGTMLNIPAAAFVVRLDADAVAEDSVGGEYCTGTEVTILDVGKASEIPAAKEYTSEIETPTPSSETATPPDSGY